MLHDGIGDRSWSAMEGWGRLLRGGGFLGGALNQMGFAIQVGWVRRI